MVHSLLCAWGQKVGGAPPLCYPDELGNQQASFANHAVTIIRMICMVRRGYSILLLFSLAGGMSARQLTARFEERYRAPRTLQATFLERYSEGGRMLRSESGIAYFRRPGKMRWEYERPERDLFLVDGKTAWFYVQADHTVTRVPAKQSGDLRTPLALLAGEMKISRICARVELAEGEKPLREGDAVLRCQVRGQKQDASAHEKEDVVGSGGADAVLFEVARDNG